MTIDTDELAREFKNLNEKYIKVDEDMLELQQKAIQGMRIIGTGCVEEADKDKFLSLKNEINAILTKMKKICDQLVEAE